jgi:hypothetical protein
VAGYPVQVSAVVLLDSDLGLLDRHVRRGLDALRLGERCEHGYISYRICPTCHKKIFSPEILTGAPTDPIV